MMTAVRKHSLINSCYNHMMIVKKLPQHQQKRYLPTLNIPQPVSSFTLAQSVIQSLSQSLHPGSPRPRCQSFDSH